MNSIVVCPYSVCAPFSGVILSCVNLVKDGSKFCVDHTCPQCGDFKEHMVGCCQKCFEKQTKGPRCRAKRASDGWICNNFALEGEIGCEKHTCTGCHGVKSSHVLACSNCKCQATKMGVPVCTNVVRPGSILCVEHTCWCGKAKSRNAEGCMDHVCEACGKLKDEGEKCLSCIQVEYMEF